MGLVKDQVIEEGVNDADVALENNQVEQTLGLTTIQEPKLQPISAAQASSIWTNPDAFIIAQRAGKLFAASEIAPQSYKGKVADCVIAIDIANRMGVSPLVVMQNSYVYQGNFAWKGTACKAMIDACGKYTSTRYVEVGTRGQDDWGYYLEAVDKQGKTIKGITVDISMAKSEGWWSRNKKWQTLTELMLKYRASAFFFRTECAGLSMGFLTEDELNDIK